jgi:hypothetical protein
MNGGGGYTPHQVGQMSLDQIWFRVCDIEILKRGTGIESTKKMDPREVASTLQPDKEGFIKGRAADGTPIKAKMGGKSLVRMMREKQEAEAKKKRKQEKRKKRRRRKDGN